MARLIRATLAVLIVMALAGGGAAAANDTAESAQVVSAQNASIRDTLTGDPGGAFRYYRFSYPGGNAPVHIHLSWNPGFHVTGPAFGFNVYGPNGLAGRGVRGDDAGEASTANLDFVSPAPGEYIVQVYNYLAGVQEGFSLDFSGLGPGPAVVTDNLSPEKAAEFQTARSNLSGSLVGKSAGAYNFFVLDYPGGRWPMTVSLSFTPASGLSADAFGFNVYKGDELVAQGVEVARTADSDTATKTATIVDVAPGAYGLQVYNYAEGVAGHYVVGVAGLPGAPVAVSGNTTGDRAAALTAASPGARSSLAGNGGGSFQYYGFNYQGNNEKITVAMGFRPGRNATGQGVGVNLYRGSELVATSLLTDGRTLAEGVAYFDYSSDQAGYYVLQVYNYIPGVTADYTIYALGLK